jgi:hypothetical protein
MIVVELATLLDGGWKYAELQVGRERPIYD